MNSKLREFPPLESFVQRALPTMLRRLWCWKGLSPTAHADLIEDLLQELRLDCLQNVDLIDELSESDRHSRWFRLMQRNHYQLRERPARARAGDEALSELTVAEGPDTAMTDLTLQLSQSDRAELDNLLQQASYLRNGRLNINGTANRMQARRNDLKQLVDRVARASGCDDEFTEFYRRRLVEALVGLAADLLRDGDRVLVLREARRRRPDPVGRLQRIRRLRSQLQHRPLPRQIRTILTRYSQHRLSRPFGADPARAPVTILKDALRLAPRDVGAHLWMFEAQISTHDLAAAARHLQKARECGAERSCIVLARARLLEARGRHAAANAMLRRALDRWPTDIRLRAAAHALEPGWHQSCA